MKNILLRLFSSNASDAGVLILRLVIGASFIIHGYPKIVGGVEVWTKLGGVMALVGITFAPAFWGLCAAVSEFFGGMALIAGFFTRPAAAGIGFTMLIATIMHVTKGDGFDKYSHPIELLSVCLFLLLAGAGRWSLDAQAAKKLQSVS